MKEIISKADLHSHTSDISDGFYKSDNRAKKIYDLSDNVRRRSMFALTDHNYINYRLSELREEMHERCIGMLGVEVDTYSEEDSLYAHLLMYANQFNPSITEALSGIRSIKKSNLLISVEYAKEIGFHINVQDMYTYFLENDGNTGNINHFQLAKYILSIEDNKRRFSQNQGTPIENNSSGAVRLMKFLFAKNIRLQHKVSGIEPEYLFELAHENSGIIVLAHPHVTFGKLGIERFKTHGPAYCKKNKIAKIEIPTTANHDWLNAIFYVADKAGIGFTFGSDSHGQADLEHGILGSKADHPIITAEFVNTQMQPLAEQFGFTSSTSA